MRRSVIFVALCVGALALAGNAQAGKRKANICHKGETINVSTSAVQAHLDHGDVLGRCEDLPTEHAVVIFRCGTGLEGGLAVTEISMSMNVPVETPAIELGENCADANATLLNNGFDLDSVNTASTTEGVVTEYMYSGEFIVVEETPTE